MEDLIGLVAVVGFWVVFFGFIALTIRRVLKWSQREGERRAETEAAYEVAQERRRERYRRGY
ncbi:hypothetical protein QM806_04260 [Rhodococcus sp. IEGM 1351]|uniref:hypothetical protein n=1 Tax=Rhodococcus sp. IEGM 1351 TaxID=3047089 RepID=UPI0024B861C0|nr:hypothetical protein [Rhodococcus sp. IEGM 1351]MDI9934667.1 hypothetical protein [Rhodococcus sp. IEGM 1351]